MQFYHNIEILSTEKYSILIELQRHYLTATPGFSICAGMHPIYPVKPVYKKIFKKIKKTIDNQTGMVYNPVKQRRRRLR